MTGDGEEVERGDLPHAEPHDAAGLLALQLREVLADLDAREREIIVRRFGLDGPAETLVTVAGRPGALACEDLAA